MYVMKRKRGTSEKTEFFHHTLDNGMNIIAEVMPGSYSVSMGFFVNAGARDESPEVSGISHFLEHLVFKGSETRTAQDVNRQFEMLGASCNACTDVESTIFYVSVLPEYLDRCIEIYADILQPAFREEDFNTEKSVVLEEICMYEDTPPYNLDELCRAGCLKGHPLANSVGGTAQSVGSLTVSQVRQHHQLHYAPEHITLVACGKVDFPQLLLMAEKYCSGWCSAGDPAKKYVRSCVPAPFYTGHGYKKRSQATQQYMFRISPGVCTAQKKKRVTAQFLSTLLGAGSTSRLYWDLVDSGKASTASVSHINCVDTGFFITSLVCAPQHYAQNRELLLNIFRTIRRDGVSAEELEFVRDKLIAVERMTDQTPRGRLFSLGELWISGGGYESLEERLRLIKSVTVYDIHDLLEQYSLTDAYTTSLRHG